jgi:hypothetical protein
MSERDAEAKPYQFCKGKSVSEMLSSSRPRYVMKTQRPWMEAYCSLDEGELQHRTAAVLRHTDGFSLWMGVLGLYHAAFSHPYNFSAEPTREHNASAVFRLDLLGLAGGNVKLALDAALAGYYSGCMALERHSLETWRRVVYARLHPLDIWRWIPRNLWPANVLPASDALSVDRGGMPTSIPKADQIARVIADLGGEEEQRNLAHIGKGFGYLSDHSHPSLEGATQTWHPETFKRRYFGPTYSPIHAVRCLEWGLFAGAILLSEVGRLAPQGAEWDRQREALEEEIGRWGQWQAKQPIDKLADR